MRYFRIGSNTANVLRKIRLDGPCGGDAWETTGFGGFFPIRLTETQPDLAGKLTLLDRHDPSVQE